jgi:hypothetical protein
MSVVCPEAPSCASPDPCPTHAPPSQPGCRVHVPGFGPPCHTQGASNPRLFYVSTGCAGLQSYVLQRVEICIHAEVCLHVIAALSSGGRSCLQNRMRLCIRATSCLLLLYTVCEKRGRFRRMCADRWRSTGCERACQCHRRSSVLVAMLFVPADFYVLHVVCRSPQSGG